MKKTTQQPTVSGTAKEVPTVSEKARSFVADVKDEIGKVTWTTPDELRVYTKIVVGMTFAMGMGIYFMDLFIQAFLTGLEMTVRMIAG